MTVLIAVVLEPSATAAQHSVTLGWSPSASSGVSAYHLYYGTASRTYTSMLSLGTVTNATVTNLTLGVTYYFAVTAYDVATGLESAYSNEAVYTIGSSNAPTLQLSVAAGKAVLKCTGLAGTNYNILGSKDLKNWSAIGTMTASTNGTFQFTDPTKATNRVYFYKIEQLINGAPTLQLSVAAGRAILNGTGLPGTNYNVLSSKNLKTWSVLGTMAASSTNGTFQFTDPTRATNLVCFYRIQQQP